MSSVQDTYKSLQKEFTAEFKDRASKFLAYLRPVSNESEFNSFLEELRSAHHKANHHCFAFRLKDENQFRYSDDGEPSGTAGKPIFNQLVSHQLKDIACIVVRYFGGTKLGTSGLINAYREACRLAIEAADIQEFYITRRIKIRFDYALMGQLMEIIKSLNYLAAESNYGEEPFLILEVRLSEYELAEKKIKAKFLHRSVEDIEEDTLVEGLGFDYP